MTFMTAPLGAPWSDTAVATDPQQQCLCGCRCRGRGPKGCQGNDNSKWSMKSGTWGFQPSTWEIDNIYNRIRIQSPFFGSMSLWWECELCHWYSLIEWISWNSLVLSFCPSMGSNFKWLWVELWVPRSWDPLGQPVQWHGSNNWSIWASIVRRWPKWGSMRPWGMPRFFVLMSYHF